MFWLSKWNLLNLHLPPPIFHFKSHVKNKWKCTCIVRDVSKAQSWRAVLAICRVIACQSQTSSLEYGQISYEGSSEVLRPSWWDWVVSGSRLLVPILPLHLPEDLLTFAFKDYFLFLISGYEIFAMCVYHRKILRQQEYRMVFKRTMSQRKLVRLVKSD